MLKGCAGLLGSTKQHQRLEGLATVVVADGVGIGGNWSSGFGAAGAGSAL